MMLRWPKKCCSARVTMSDVLSIGQQSFWQKFGVACSGCPVAALDFTADCCWGRSGAARGSAFRHPLYALPQSFQNPSKRSDLHENYPADVELTPPTGGPAWRGPSC